MNPFLEHDARLILNFLKLIRVNDKCTPSDTECIYLLKEYFEDKVSFDEASELVNKYLLEIK